MAQLSARHRRHGRDARNDHHSVPTLGTVCSVALSPHTDSSCLSLRPGLPAEREPNLTQLAFRRAVHAATIGALETDDDLLPLGVVAETRAIDRNI